MSEQVQHQRILGDNAERRLGEANCIIKVYIYTPEA